MFVSRQHWFLTQILTLFNNVKYFSFVLLALWLTSCSHPYEKEMAEIDEMLSVLDDAEKQINSIDTMNLQAFFSTYDGQIRYLQQHYQPNTIDTVFAKALTGYKAVKWLGPTFAENKRLAREEITFSRTNLKALRENLSAKKFTSEEAAEYMKDEKQAVGEIVTGIAMMIKSANLARQMFEQYYPVVEAEIAKIKAGNPQEVENE